MPVTATDLKAYLSGGASNTDKNASIGGIISSTLITDNVVANLFDNVSYAESVAGDIEYRCFYLKNTNGTDTVTAVLAWIQSQTPSGSTVIAIGLDPAGVGNGSTTGVAATPADENTAPSGVTFSTSPVDAASGLAIGTMTAGQAIAIWIRRTITALAPSVAHDPATIRIQGTP